MIGGRRACGNAHDFRLAGFGGCAAWLRAADIMRRTRKADGIADFESCYRIAAGRGLYRRRNSGRRAEPLIYLVRNIAVFSVQIIAGAGLICKPAMHGHILLIHLPDEALVTPPKQLFNAIELVNLLL